MAEQTTSPGEDASFDDVLAGSSARNRSIKVCLRGDLLAEIERLTAELPHVQLADSTENRPAEAPALAKRIVELTEEAQAAKVEFVFEPLGRRAWRDLVAEHPPTDEQKAAGGDFDTETLPAVAMGKSCVSPKGATEAKFRKLADGKAITDAQWNLLWATCWAANTGGEDGADIPLSGRAYALARGTETSSASRGTTDSLAASS